jgi:hypothetical protein
MIIDDRGRIEIKDMGLVISSEFTLEDINKSPFKDRFELKVTPNAPKEYRHYRLRDVIIDNIPFVLSINFMNNKISGLSLVVEETKGWEELFEKSRLNRNQEQFDTILNKMNKEHLDFELFKKKAVDNLLLAQHNATKKEFSWGSFFSVYDDRAGFSDLRVAYK